MTSNPVQRKWTFEEYLAYEEETDIKHEYLDGEIYAMAGSTENHSLITLNTTTEIGLQLRGKSCRQHSPDMKIKISDIRYLYPDFSVVCGQAIFDDDKHTILTNPTLVAEVLSDSSEKYDKGLKSELYRKLPSLKHYLIIDQSRVHVQLYTRQAKGWLLLEFDQRNQIIPLETLDVNLPVSEIYRGIEFGGNDVR